MVTDKIVLRDFARDITSQNGENGIIDKVFKVIGTTGMVCVEFGAHHLTHISNVAPLWMDQGWRTVLIEGDAFLCRGIRDDYGRYRRDHPGCGEVTIVETFVTPRGEDSLDNILARLKTPVDLDLISIDVDGIDYHIWAGIEVYRPRVVVIEYNNTAPPDLRLIGKDTGNSFGASALSMYELGRRKGYALVACTGCNMVFVLDEFGGNFANCNDLDALFDYGALVYVMRTYEGGLFYSKKPTHGHNPFSLGPERSLSADAGVYFSDKSFRTLLDHWIREMRVRARSAPLRRGIFIGLAAILRSFHAVFGWLFKDPDIR